MTDMMKLFFYRYKIYFISDENNNNNKILKKGYIIERFF